MIARVTACEISATFYTASCAELTSRWAGGSEDKLQQLFKPVVANAPSIVFLDEINSIAGIRGQESTIANQRLTNQLIIELDEINTQQSPVFVIASTNLPWQIDDAVMRRLSRKTYIPMPTHKARFSMFQQAFQKNPEVTKQSIESFAHVTKCLSGSDIAMIISHVNFQPLRILYTCTIFAVVMQGAHVQSVAVFSDETHRMHVAPLGSAHENEDNVDSNKMPTAAAVSAAVDLVNAADLVDSGGCWCSFGSEGMETRASWAWATRFLGQGDKANRLAPTLVGVQAAFGGSSVLTVACGDCHSLVVTKDVVLWTFGRGSHGALSHNEQQAGANAH